MTDSTEGSAVGVPMTGGRVFSPNQLVRARTVMARLYTLRRAARLYPAEHPALAENAHQLFEVLAQYHAEGIDVPITFANGEVFLGEQLLAEDSVLFDQLVRDMMAIGVDSVTFKRDLTPGEVARFASVLTAQPADTAVADRDVKRIVNQMDTPHIVVSAVSVVHDLPSDGDLSQEAKVAYAGALDLLREVERLVRANRTMNLTHVRGAVRGLIDNVVHNPSAMLELSGLKSHDEYTFYHSVNVAILSLAMGSVLTKDYRFLSSLGTGALLHDIGKSKIDPGVLNKRGQLTRDEWAEMRRHAEYGAEIAALTNGLDRAPMVCILEHHMRYDGSGYPETSPKRAQRLPSRIVAVADVYDAMTSQRAYSASRRQDEAMGVVTTIAGTVLDPAVVRLFVRLMGYYPPRSIVLLDTGEIAVVLSASPADPRRPVVRVITSERGDITEPYDVDLTKQGNRERSVASCLDAASVNVDVSDYL